MGRARGFSLTGGPTVKRRRRILARLMQRRALLENRKRSKIPNRPTKRYTGRDPLGFMDQLKYLLGP